ncbi:MAG: aminoacyl-tRNA hydrolase, partial [Pseudomonadota bacterium]
GISDGTAELARGDWGRFMNAVSLQTAPPRSSKSKVDTAQTAAKTIAVPKDTRSALQKLMDKFQ